MTVAGGKCVVEGGWWICAVITIVSVSLDEKLLRVHGGEGLRGEVGRLWSSEERSDEQSSCCAVGKSDANGLMEVILWVGGEWWLKNGL